MELVPLHCIGNIRLGKVALGFTICLGLDNIFV